MSKITVLHIVGGMNRGGAETFLMNVLRNIDISKFQFIFLCYGEEKFDYEDEIIELGGKIVRTPDVKEVGAIKHIENIENVLQSEQIDVVQAHTYFNSMFSLIAAKKAGVKVRIAHSHNTKSEESPSLLKSIYFNVSKFIVNKYSTHYLACGKDAGEALFYKKNKFTIVDNGIILQDFYYDADKKALLRKEFGIPKNYTVIMHVGRFDEQKNHTFLVDIYKEYARLNPDSVLLSIGDGPLRPYIERKVGELKLQENVRFLGKRSDVHNLYNVADLFLFPSLFEGLPVVLVETQANGMTCLISDTIDKSTKITESVHFYPLANSAKEWAQKIDQLDLKRSDNKKVLEASSFNIVKKVKDIESLYEEVLS